MVVKMNEIETRGDVEAELRNCYNRFTFDGEPVIGNQVAGLVIALGPYHVALLEAEEDKYMDIVLSGMNATIRDSSLYENGWVVHCTEEVSNCAKYNDCR
jgi:hypothetical protein